MWAERRSIQGDEFVQIFTFAYSSGFISHDMAHYGANGHENVLKGASLCLIHPRADSSSERAKPHDWVMRCSVCMSGGP